MLIQSQLQATITQIFLKRSSLLVYPDVKMSFIFYIHATFLIVITPRIENCSFWNSQQQLQIQSY